MPRAAGAAPSSAAVYQDPACANPPNPTATPLPLPSPPPPPPQPPCSLVSLPDAALSLIFSHLSSGPSDVAPNPDTLPLARVCSRLHSFYRNEVVTSFVLNHYVAPWILSRQLLRFPSVDRLHIDLRALPVFLDTRAALTCRGAPSRPAAIAAVSLHHATLSRDGVEALVRLCPRLTALELVDCAPFGDAQLRAITAALGTTLRTLVLRASGKLDVTDAAGEALCALPLLRKLDLAHFGALSSLSFAAIAALERLEELYLDDTRVTDADLLCVAELPNLRRLNISQCESLSRDCLPCLPKSLRHLELNQTFILEDAVPASVLGEGLPNLSSLRAHEAVNLTSWAPLTLVLRRLTSLSVNGSSLTDCGAAEALGAARYLKELCVADMPDVGDGVAAAVAGCARLQWLEMGNTAVTNEGIAAVASGVCCETLQYVDFRYCDTVKDPEKAASELRKAMVAPDAVVVAGSEE